MIFRNISGLSGLQSAVWIGQCSSVLIVSPHRHTSMMRHLVLFPSVSVGIENSPAPPNSMASLHTARVLSPAFIPKYLKLLLTRPNNMMWCMGWFCSCQTFEEFLHDTIFSTRGTPLTWGIDASVPWNLLWKNVAAEKIICGYCVV